MHNDPQSTPAGRKGWSSPQLPGWTAPKLTKLGVMADVAKGPDPSSVQFAGKS